MNFNLHRGLSRIIDTIFWGAIFALIIGFFVSVFFFFTSDLTIKEIGYLTLIGFVIAGGAFVIRWLLYYIINGFFDGK